MANLDQELNDKREQEELHNVTGEISSLMRDYFRSQPGGAQVIQDVTGNRVLFFAADPGSSPLNLDEQQERASRAAERADREEERADREAMARKAAEAENARLRAEIERLRGER